MLAPPISETIRSQIDPEFAHRNHTLPQTVEARLRRLVADRGQGGHLTVEISWLLADEMRQRTQAWAAIIMRNCRAAGTLESCDLRAVLEPYAIRDRDWIASMMQERYRWLQLTQSEIDFAMANEIDKQVGNAAVTLSAEHEGSTHVTSHNQSAGITAANVTIGQVNQHVPASQNPATSPRWRWWEILVGAATIVGTTIAVIQYYWE